MPGRKTAIKEGPLGGIQLCLQDLPVGSGDVGHGVDLEVRMGVLQLLDELEHARIRCQRVPSLGERARDISLGDVELLADLLIAFVLLERPTASSHLDLHPC